MSMTTPQKDNVFDEISKSMTKEEILKELTKIQEKMGMYDDTTEG